MNKSDYRVNRIDNNSFSNINYIGYIDGEEAGMVTGYSCGEYTIDIRYSLLKEQFRGAKMVRAFREIIDAIQKDFPNILIRIHDQNNRSIQIALSHDFHITGVSLYGGEVVVELLKTKGEI
jgi:hypothetical protein|tara:strand:- start:719 stop:1081 length:363 start_codon:yes stop_codon:yes gene_type:complete